MNNRVLFEILSNQKLHFKPRPKVRRWGNVTSKHPTEKRLRRKEERQKRKTFCHIVFVKKINHAKKDC